MCVRARANKEKETMDLNEGKGVHGSVRREESKRRNNIIITISQIVFKMWAWSGELNDSSQMSSGKALSR